MSRIVLRGRDAELATVMSALHSAAGTGEGAMIVITGEPGIGKSALLRVVTEQAAGAGFVVGSGKAEEIGQIAPGNIKLQLGSSSTVIEVRAEAAHVNEEQATVQDVLTAQDIDELPVNGRNFLDLAILEPGKEDELHRVLIRS